MKDLNIAQVQHILDQCVTATFEEMAFCEAWPLREDDPRCGVDWISGPAELVRICIEMVFPIKGMLCVECTAELGRELASIVIGNGPEELAGDDIADFMKEVLNTITGTLVRSVCGEDDTMVIGLPERRNESQGFCGQGILCRTYEVSGHLLKICGCMVPSQGSMK